MVAKEEREREREGKQQPQILPQNQPLLQQHRQKRWGSYDTALPSLCSEKCGAEVVESSACPLPSISSSCRAMAVCTYTHKTRPANPVLLALVARTVAAQRGSDVGGGAAVAAVFLGLLPVPEEGLRDDRAD